MRGTPNCEGQALELACSHGDTLGSLPLTACSCVFSLTGLGRQCDQLQVTGMVTGPSEIRSQQSVPSTLSSFSEIPC